MICTKKLVTFERHLEQTDEIAEKEAAPFGAVFFKSYYKEMHTRLPPRFRVLPQSPACF